MDGALRFADGTNAAECAGYRNPPPGYAAATADGIYWIKPDSGAPFQAYCNMSVAGGGWTLLASFINSDGTVSWTRPVGDANWRNATTFGALTTWQAADYKSAAWSRLPVTDLLVTDDGGGWLSYSGVIERRSFLGQVQTYSACQQSPLVFPGDPRINSSSTSYRRGAMLAFFAADGNASNVCSFSGSHSDSTILAIGGHNCGTIGAGQWGTNYTGSSNNTGLDWHANLDEGSVCVGCDSCGPWYGNTLVNSAEHSNNAGSTIAARRDSCGRGTRPMRRSVARRRTRPRAAWCCGSSAGRASRPTAPTGSTSTAPARRRPSSCTAT